MKTLYAIRHAKSSWKYPDLPDEERPLKGRGKRDSKVMGNWLKEKSIRPDIMISSHAKRAFSTAKRIAKKIGDEEGNIKRDDRLYFEGTSSIFEVIRQMDDKNESAFIFGHNPDFTDFANIFAPKYIDNVPTCGIVCIEFDIRSWVDADRDNGTLKFFEYPSKHR